MKLLQSSTVLTVCRTKGAYQNFLRLPEDEIRGPAMQGQRCGYSVVLARAVIVCVVLRHREMTHHGVEHLELLTRLVPHLSHLSRASARSPHYRICTRIQLCPLCYDSS